ncbi:MAG: sigma 54-interacting transcriptional regulator, partial [Clostridia bacterium]|nr:sigma 54-interacting transcriptional regulator [Clostridia bacterium]
MKKKALVSFISYDQDSFDFKKTDKSFVESFMLDAGKSLNEDSGNTQANRLKIWRPSVALAKLQHANGLSDIYEELFFDSYYIMYDNAPSHKTVVDEVLDDIKHVKPKTTNLIEIVHSFANPWNTREVYDYLIKTARKYFNDDDTDYYFNCTAGTTAMRNCLFLLTQTGQLSGLRIAPTPWRNHKQRGRKSSEQPNIYKEDGRRTSTGSYTLENPDEFWESYEKSGEGKKPKNIPEELMEGIVTEDDAMLDCLQKLAHLTECLTNMGQMKFEHPILLTGETGTGKTRLANNISSRLGLDGGCISVNCATIGGGDPNITRAELFGCKAGIVGNIKNDVDGALKKADGGVLFLDEIGELDMQTQAMLLKAIEEHKFTPLSGDPSNPVESNFLLVCGTNRDLGDLVAKGKFRLDLLNRINMWHFELPPLRDRRKDFEKNCRKYLEEVCGKYRKKLVMARAAENALLDHCNDANVMWEGNFREFNAMLTRLVVLSFTEETRREITITLEQVKAEIERHKSELERGRRSESAEEEPSPAHAPADKGEFPLLSELLGVKL